MDQKPVTLTQPRRHDDIGVHGGNHLGQGRSLYKTHPFRHRQNLPGWDRHVLRVPATGEQHGHPVTHLPLLNPVTNPVDGPGGLEPQNVRGTRRGSVKTQALEDVGPIDAGGLHLHNNLARLGGRNGGIGKFQGVWTARLRSCNRAHTNHPTCTIGGRDRQTRLFHAQWRSASRGTEDDKSTHRV